MASNSQVSKCKRSHRRKNAGHKRKMAAAKKSTQSYAELFASCGEPGKPAAPAQ